MLQHRANQWSAQEHTSRTTQCLLCLDPVQPACAYAARTQPTCGTALPHSVFPAASSVAAMLLTSAPSQHPPTWMLVTRLLVMAAAGSWQCSCCSALLAGAQNPACRQLPGLMKIVACTCRKVGNTVHQHCQGGTEVPSFSVHSFEGSAKSMRPKDMPK
jgi:hypothetical protein